MDADRVTTFVLVRTTDASIWAPMVISSGYGGLLSALRRYAGHVAFNEMPLAYKFQHTTDNGAQTPPPGI